MGSNSSKSIETAGQAQKKDLNVDANPDPRSPTPEITRTPLQSKNGSKHNITKNMDLRKTFESGHVDEKLIHNNPILSAVIKNHLQFYDPRSPTQEFERTPIVIPSNDENGIAEKNILRLKNEDIYGSPCLNIDSFNASEDVIKLSPDLVVAKNLCDGFLDMSQNDTLKEIDEPLGSSTTSNNYIENNLSPDNKDQPSKLLETNFEYVEVGNEIFEDSEDIIAEASEKLEVEFKNVPVFQILDTDPRSPSLGIERTPIVLAKAEEATGMDNVEELSDDVLIKVLQSTNGEETNEEGKDSLCVYEDERIFTDTPKKAKSIGSNGARTPLSCMKNKGDTTHTRSKSANNYEAKKESALPVKHHKFVSHIPRLKSLSKPALSKKSALMGSSISLKSNSKSSAISGDCENTPPQSHRDIWDKDNSIVL